MHFRALRALDHFGLSRSSALTRATRQPSRLSQLYSFFDDDKFPTPNMADGVSAEDLAHLTLKKEELDTKGERSSKRRGGRGGGGQSREVQISRALSRLLRHQAHNVGIQLDGEGYAPLDKVLSWHPLKSLNVSLGDTKSIVQSNEKQRFALKPRDASVADDSTSPADYLIRANQGHSIKLASSSVLKPLSVEAGNIPPRVVHGTYFAFWPSILASGGLKPMGRTHVHCSTGTPGNGVTSGMRKDAELLIEIDVERSMKEAGLQWWISDNNVILTEGDDQGLLSSKFFSRVEGRKGNVGVLWEEGQHKADLPAGLKIRVPQGKGPGGRGSRKGGRGRRVKEEKAVEE